MLDFELKSRDRNDSPTMPGTVNYATAKPVDIVMNHSDDPTPGTTPTTSRKTKMVAPSSMRTMPRYFSTFELSQKAKSEKTLLSNKRHKEDAMGQTEDEKLLEIFKADLKAGEFRELDPVKIFHQEACLSDGSNFRASTQSMMDLEASLNEIIMDDLMLDDESKQADDAGMTRGVTFSEVRIREYPMLLGDNPGGSLVGPPVTIGWRYIPFASIDIEKYEMARNDHRRKTEELRMSPDFRFTLLKKTGYGLGDILTAAKEAKRARRRRMSTLCRLHCSRREEFFEKLRRKWKNLVSFGKIRREEKAYLAEHVPSRSTKPRTKNSRRKKKQ